MTEENRVRRVVGDAKRWKALSHPLRGEILRHLDENGPANSTAIAAALGESTGSASYHLRVLAEAGVIDEVPERARGRERWWRTVPTDHREPDYDSLSESDRAALDRWRAMQEPGERALVERFLREYRRHGRWAKAMRVSRYFTADELDAMFEEFHDVVNRHGHATAAEAPPDARAVQMRLFYLPEDPAPDPPDPPE